MNEKFLRLNSEKQRRILQAICEEFTEHSYEDASTNRIVEKAGIGQGTLFNYFGCKEGMYHSLLRYVLDFFKGYAIDGFETGDFIERCRLLAELDMRIYQEAPYMINFFAKIFTADQKQVPVDITETLGILLSDAMEKLYDGVDCSIFREDVDPVLLMQMIRFTFDGYMKEVIEKIKMGGFDASKFEVFTVDYYVFLKEMKKIYYRKGVFTNVKNFKEKSLYQQVGFIAVELVLLYLIVVNLDRIFGGVRTFLGVISPFIMGAAIAYLLNKPALGIQHIYEKSGSASVKKNASTLSVISVFLIVILIFGAIVNIAVPIIVSNIGDFALNLAGYYDEFIHWIDGLDSDDFLYGLIPDLSGNLMDFISPDLVAGIGTGAAQFAGHIMNITSSILNIFLGIIAALYMLLTKENIVALVQRLMGLFMKKRTYDRVVNYASKSNRIFYKFVRAQFLDACILGTLGTIILAILGVPYAVTLGFLLAFCNMIPIFGSIFATIVTTFVTIFTGGPMLAFITFIALLILQQIDANFIGPKIAGDALGLKPLLIIFAIVVGGAYFGIIGMFVSVPIVAMLKMFLEDFMDAREKKLKLKEGGSR